MDLETARVVVAVSRPAGWSFGPILYAIGLVHSPRRLCLAVLVQLVSLSFPLALVVFGINDVHDYASDLRNPRKTAHGLEGTVLDPSYHSTVVLSASLATAFILAAALLIRRPSNAIVIAILLVLSWEYSAPPLRLKERPILDSLSNGAIVDLAYLAGYTAGGGALDRRMLTLKGHVLGLCTAGVHALGAAVDVEADAAVGQRTIATVLGPTFAVGFALTNYLFALAIEHRPTVFGIYITGGLLLLLAPLLDTKHTHMTFQAIVYWTIVMSAAWFAQKALLRSPGRRSYA